MISPFGKFSTSISLIPPPLFDKRPAQEAKLALVEQKVAAVEALRAEEAFDLHCGKMLHDKAQTLPLSAPRDELSKDAPMKQDEVDGVEQWLKDVKALEQETKKAFRCFGAAASSSGPEEKRQRVEG